MDEGEPPLGERPAEDELEVSVAEARIASRLFGVESEVRVGRYKLLELVGRGGMGVVWGAWDPDLERKVAIKLVDPMKPTARDRIVDEARAMAKLSHPNVVPIYDVGVVDERVYLVMEWITGDNLRVHLHEQRRPREIVALFIQAARGLAAVHAAGLVHRDFKPENAIVGVDGRVRVLDFGLARHDIDTPATDIAGTPRYMAPEHVAGARPTPAVDQYALCIALREALEHGEREVPRWLAIIIERGTAPTPGARYSSIEELIRALERDPARVWRARIIAGTAIAATAAAFVVGRAAERETCTGTRIAIPAAMRAQIAAHLDALGGFAAESRDALLAHFDDHQRRFSDAVHGSCIAHARGEITPALYERRLTCLARAETSLLATAEILESSTVATFPEARVAASALIDPTTCTRVDESLVPMPDEASIEGVRAVETAIERARMLATAERPEAVAAATGARIAAEAAHYPPVLARALLAEGRAQMFASDARASRTLASAQSVAFAAHDDAIAVEAFARRAHVVARQATVIDGTTLIREIADRLPAENAFAQQLLLNNLATVKLMTSNDTASARELLETAMRTWRPGRGENDYELVSILQNLAVTVGDRSRGTRLLEQAHTEVVRLFGSNHPRVLEIERFQAVFLDLASARTLVESVCARYHRLFPQLTRAFATCTYDAGWLADEAGDATATRAFFGAAQIDATADPTIALIRTSMVAVGAGEGTAERAIALEQAANTAAAEAGPWRHLIAADAYIAAARTWEQVGNSPASRRCWSLSAEILASIDRPPTARRLARATRAKEI